MNAGDILRKEKTLDSLNLLRSYEVGGLQLANHIEVKRDYIRELEKKYPGIETALRVRAIE